MQKDISTYPKKDAYLSDTCVLLEKLDELSRLHGVPYFFSAAVASSKDKTTYISKNRSALTMGLHLKEDHIVEHLKVCSGFRTYATQSLPDVDL